MVVNLESLKVAVVGLGKMGLLHASILNVLPNVDLAGLCDKSVVLRRFLKKVNLGVIGLGHQGRIHLRNCLHLKKEVKVLGVADVSEKALRFAKKIGVKNVYTDYEDLLKNEQIDAVVISLPNFLHLEGAHKGCGGW